MRLLQNYLSRLHGAEPNTAAAAVYANLDHLAATAPDVAADIVQEFRDQRSSLKLIASENYSSLAVQLAQGNWLTDKYAEGYAGHRFYAGCENIDRIEARASSLACKLFNAEHAYVQPHSGADANLIAFCALLGYGAERPVLQEFGEKDPGKLNETAFAKLRAAFWGQRLLGLDYYSGGHLTHGYRHNLSSRLFECHSYGVDRETRLIDLDALRKQLHEVKPLVLLAGYSAYPRKINFAKMRELADEVGALFMVDMAHCAGLVAGKVFAGDYDPVPHAHLVTSTTHKTLRGPRGGLILCKKELAEFVDKGCPLVIGGPLPHVMAAKSIAFAEASQPAFADYAERIVQNARALADECVKQGLPVSTGGTDNHIVLIDVATRYGLTGRHAESALRECGITLNRNSLPFDTNGPWYTSGLRLGTAALTTLGMGENELREVARIIRSVLDRVTPTVQPDGQPSKAKFNLDRGVVADARGRVADLLGRHVLYPELDLGLINEEAPLR
ncbi:MAG: glycine hydroxymethyltransferase [Polyangiaceae bacterium]